MKIAHATLSISSARPWRVLLLGLALVATAVATYRAPLWLERFGVAGGILIAVLGTGSLALVWVAARQRSLLVRRIAWELLAFGACLLAVETLIAIYRPHVPTAEAGRQRLARKIGIPFDSRSISRVVADLRAQGVDAFPGIARGWPRIPQVRRELPTGFYPLSHASNASIVECNEDGRYLVYESDEFGFNNPRGLIASGHLDIGVVGESYALGHCLPRKQSLVGIIRRKFPHTATFAMAATGPLSGLASFREYIEPLKPSVVVWTVHPFFSDTADDLADPILQRYWDPSFSQNLMERQDETDRYVRAIAIPVQAEADSAAEREIEHAMAGRFWKIPFLPQFRARITNTFFETPHPRPNLGPLVQSLQMARDTAAGWGGQLVVLLLPTYTDVVKRQSNLTERHELLKKALAQMGVPVVEGVELFRAQRDPAGLFTLRMGNHPTAEGYALLAQHLVTTIDPALSAQVARADLK